MAANFVLKSSGPELKVDLFGVLTAQAVREVLSAITPKLSGVSACIINTMGVNDCLEEARAELVRLQQAVAARVRRTAWVDDRARFRGVALWVMHLAGDPNAKAVANADQAAKWLASNELREAAAERRTVGA
ncbi:MAG: hypothetical protein AB1730_26395 [Myxococcota bacterium]